MAMHFIVPADAKRGTMKPTRWALSSKKKGVKFFWSAFRPTTKKIAFFLRVAHRGRA